MQRCAHGWAIVAPFFVAPSALFVFFHLLQAVVVTPVLPVVPPVAAPFPLAYVQA